MALSPDDHQKLNESINSALGKVPGFLKGMVLNRPLPEYLLMIPQEFHKYTIQELTEALNESFDSNKIEW